MTDGTAIRIDKNVVARMRDDVELVADVWRPADGAPVPALLQRTPYNKEMSPSAEIMRFARSGYAVVIQDVRGRFASGANSARSITRARTAWTRSLG